MKKSPAQLSATTSLVPKEEGAQIEFLPQTPAGRDRTPNAALAYLATLHSETSRIAMRSKLNVVARLAGYADLTLCPWEAMAPEHVIAMLETLERQGRRANTVNCYLAAIKGVAKAAWLVGSLSHEVMLRISAIKQRRTKRLPAGRSLTPSESRALLADCDTRNDAIGRRDKAILSLMLGCGLRRGEIPDLRWENYDQNEGALTLIGKGDKERRVFLPEEVESYLLAWIKKDRGENYGLLFGRIYKNGRIDLTRPMDARSIGDILASHRIVEGRSAYTAHDLRRTFATRLLEDNVDIVTVQGMMGHASVTTTARYDRRGNDKYRRAANNIKLT